MDYVDTMIVESMLVILGYIIEVIINIAVWVFIFKLIRNSIKRKSNHDYFKNNIVINKKIETKSGTGNKYQRTYNDVSKSDLAKFNTDDINSLKDYFYDMFLEFENAYNNLDYNMMKILSTKQLYQNYYTGMSLDLKVGKKRIISDIEKKKVIIFELDSTIAKQIASVMIEISYLNYTIDKNGYVISGSRNQKTTEKFEVMFRKDFEREEITKCPNCGAEIIGNKCSFCRSTIKNIEFKISSIKKIVNEQ